MKRQLEVACACLEQARDQLLTPSAGSLSAAADQVHQVLAISGMWSASQAMAKAHAGEVARLAELVRQVNRMLHHGASLRLDCGAITFPEIGQYTQSGSPRMPASNPVRGCREG
jgi:hypothetical protein